MKIEQYGALYRALLEAKITGTVDAQQAGSEYFRIRAVTLQTKAEDAMKVLDEVWVESAILRGKDRCPNCHEYIAETKEAA
jgi:hypothetical protein